MSKFSRFHLIEPYYSHYPSLLLTEAETSIVVPKPLSFPDVEDFDFDFAFDLLSHSRVGPPAFDVFDSFTDLVQIDEAPSFSSYRRIRRVERSRDEVLLRKLSDRVTQLESRIDRLASARFSRYGDQKYTWTKEIKGVEKNSVDRKYKLVAEIKDGKKKNEGKNGGVLQNYKWSAEIKGKNERDPVRKYTVEVSTGNGSEGTEKEEKKKKGKKVGNETRVVEIEDSDDHGAVVLRQAFAKRSRVIESKKGKKKELCPQDAAIIIQISFREYLIHRSKVLRALRDLSVAKTKLKELRASFNNYAYSKRLAWDAEERQRFTEKLIVLLLTVDAIEGVDLMVRTATRSMIVELEAMLDVVDPQPAKRSISFRRRMFDMPSQSINEEIAAGVAEVVEMIDQAENNVNAHESSE
ncbi:BAG family molecular chaperone regulator 7-like [Cucurbita moschata]|uniref:BAG family molecular chaperone regulator 7-like n=1 Tax=Cucurbita moschata TaxID=3662 RepID=A0A6J1EIT2_CUCMO|nr:BAG family molecular chaperone regulator 7-like [Cucurbita moschata]